VNQKEINASLDMTIFLGQEEKKQNYSKAMK
jgi:hypothetical protein